jgi:hypothetical protein
LVKIQQRIAPRNYLKGKGKYNYERRNVSVIKRYHPVSNPFLKQELDEKVMVHTGSLVIVLTPKKAKKGKEETKTS